MNDKAVTEFIVDQLGAGKDRNDVIMELCRQLGVTWQEAEKAVVMVENVSRRSIAARQSPFLVLIGIVTLFAGLILLGYGVYRLAFGAYLSRATYVAILTGGAMVLGGGWGTLKAVLPLLS